MPKPRRQRNLRRKNGTNPGHIDVSDGGGEKQKVEIREKKQKSGGDGT